MRIDPGIGAKRKFDPGLDRLLEPLPLGHSGFGVFAHIIVGIVVALAHFVGPVAIVDVHVEKHAARLGHGDAFIVDQAGMLDPAHPGANCRLDTLGPVGMGGHP